MVAPIVIIIVAVIVVIGVVGMIYMQGHTGLQIENPRPSILIVKEYGDPQLDFQIHSYDNMSWKDLEISVDAENSSGDYFITQSKKFGSIDMGKDSSRNLSFNPVHVLKSEGSEMTYDLNLTLKDNENELDSHKITLKITPNFIPKPNIAMDKKLIKFIDISDTSITSNKFQNKSIKFKVISDHTATYDSIKIIPEIFNNSGKFVKMNSVQSKEILSTKGDKTGIIEIPIQVLDSEGSEIKYNVSLGLYNGDIRMDTRQIELIIKP